MTVWVFPGGQLLEAAVRVAPLVPLARYTSSFINTSFRLPNFIRLSIFKCHRCILRFCNSIFAFLAFMNSKIMQSITVPYVLILLNYGTEILNLFTRPGRERRQEHKKAKCGWLQQERPHQATLLLRNSYLHGNTVKRNVFTWFYFNANIILLFYDLEKKKTVNTDRFEVWTSFEFRTH